MVNKKDQWLMVATSSTSQLFLKAGKRGRKWEEM